jgi:RHS repeat-associated protein
MRPADPDDPSVGVGRWGQSETPTYGAAVFGADHNGVTTSVAASVAPADWPHADLQYTRSDGRVVDTASYANGDWRYTATAYDTYGNVVKSWDERGVEGVLASGSLDAGTIASYATVTAYNAVDIKSTAVADGPEGTGSVPSGTLIVPKGTRVTDVWAPATDATDAAGGALRTHTHTDYDAGAPNHGVNPATGLAFGLATSVTTTQVDEDDTSPAAGETVVAKTVSGYDPVDGASATGATSGWTLSVPTVSTTVTDFATGAGITTKTVYDAEGRAIRSIGAKDAAAGTATANTTVTTYYTATGSGTCGAHAEWAGLTCQATTAESVPALPVTTTQYGFYLVPTLVTESRDGVTRTARTWYDGAGRATDTLATTAGLAAGAPGATTTTYNTAGLVDHVASIDPASIPAGGKPSAGTETRRTTSTYDAWGRTVSYVDATGARTTTAYVAPGADAPGAGSVQSVEHVGADTTTYVYDDAGRTVRQTTTLGSASYTYTAGYTPVGDLDTQTMPAGIVQTNAYSRDGQLSGLGYSGPDAAGTMQPLLAWTLTSDVQGRTAGVETNAGGDDTSTGRALGYTYDTAGRLTDVLDQRGGTCQTRAYGFDVNGNRTAQMSTTHDGGDCADPDGTTTLAKTWSSIDAADRVLSGATLQASAVDEDGAGTTADPVSGGAYVYDALGRQVVVPAVDTPAGAGGGDLQLGYFDTDAARTITQGATTTTYTLDPGGRRASSTVSTAGQDDVAVVRHYDDPGDSPAWATSTTGTDAAVPSVYGSSIAGDLALTVTGGIASLALADPHGDTVTTVDVPTDGTPALLGAVACYDEYGNPLTDLNQTHLDADGEPLETTTKLNTGAVAYGWLGAKQRASDGSGLLLMGVRLYNPTTGLFTSVDPVPGGNTTAYAYPQDPINSFDLDGRMAVVALVALALPEIAASEVILAVGLAVLAGLAVYAIWHGRSAAVHKVQILWAKKKPAKNAGRSGHQQTGKSAPDVPNTRSNDKHSKAQGHGGRQHLPPNPNKRRPLE